MQADHFLWDAVQRTVECIDVQPRQSLIFLVALILEHHVSPKPEVRRVELQDNSGIDNRAVFVCHRLGQCVEVIFVRRVMFVGLKQRNDARRSGIHEALRRQVFFVRGE